MFGLCVCAGAAQDSAARARRTGSQGCGADMRERMGAGDPRDQPRFAEGAGSGHAVDPLAGTADEIGHDAGRGERRLRRQHFVDRRRKA